MLWVYECFCPIPSPSVYENWVFLFFEFWDPILSFGGVWVHRTYRTFNLARFHFSVSSSASVKGTVANSMLFASVPCNASINKSSASHFCPVRVRILWLLAAVNCLSLPFTYRPPYAAALLFSLPPFPVLSTSNSLKRGSISPSLIQRAWKRLSRIVCYIRH